MKKILLISAMIIMLMGAMFILTGCGEETTDTNTATNTTDNTSNVIQVPMTVQNMYPVDITELYLSGAGLSNWGEDVLGGQVLSQGTQIPLVLTIDAENVKWDIKAVDSQGTEVEFMGLDLSNVSTAGGTIVLQADENGNPVVTAQ